MLQGAVAVVVADTATGTGAAVVDALLGAGARVVVAGPDARDGVTGWEGAVPGPAGVPGLLEHAEQQVGPVEVVVLDVPAVPDVPLQELTPAHWAPSGAALETVLQGLRSGLALMTPRGRGRVVVTMGAEGKVGRSGAGAAVAVEHAAYGLVKVAAKEGGPHGVTVNAVLAARDLQGSLVGRLTAPAEVAAAVLLLASPAGGGMSGVAFPVDGGVAPY